jgi:uncharacterized membrane protein YbaN (DUF454 family)
MKLLNYFLIGLGTLFVAIGAIGVVIPLLPTTPFLLLAAACYVRASDRFYNRLLGNRYLGSYVRDYREKGGIRKRAKIITIIALWATISLSSFIISDMLITLSLVLIASAVTLHLVSLGTLPNDV